jgi:hypothetical protein
MEHISEEFGPILNMFHEQQTKISENIFKNQKNIE